jgi:hypothetical protein
MIEDLRSSLGTVIYRYGDASPIDDWQAREIKSLLKRTEFNVDEQQHNSL